MEVGMKLLYTLCVNNPKTGWAHAVDEDVQDLPAAHQRASELLKKNKKLQFTLTITTQDKKKGCVFWLQKGEFVHISGGEPAWLWLTQYGVTTEAI